VLEALVHPLLWTFLLAAAQSIPPSATQPTADRLLDDRGFAAAVSELEGSSRVRIETIARSHQGRPVVLIVVGMPEALADLERHRRTARAIAGPRVIHSSLAATRIEEDATLDARIAGARLPVLFAGASWGHEAAQVEGLLQAARTLAFEDTEEVRRTLSRTIALFIPLMNPDGRAAALREWKETPLSNGDSGAGNAYGFLLNRDFLHGTQPEARGVIETILRWRPVAVVDQHEDMFNLGVRLPEVCFVEPFEPGFDIEEHPLTRAATVDLGRAIAARWRGLGFKALFDESGDRRFAPAPEPGKGLNPVAGSAGRLNLLATLHGIPSFITESSRTPGSQSWRDRVEQKASSALATLIEVSARPERYARAISDRRIAEVKEAGQRFLVIPEKDQPHDGLAELLDLLELHRVSVYRVDAPYPAFVVPLAQAESRTVRHLLLAERSRLNQTPPALGVRVVASESLSDSDRRAFEQARLQPAVLVPPAPPKAGGPFTTRPTVRSTALVNRLLASGAARISQQADRYYLSGDATAMGWEAGRLGVPVEPAVATPGAALPPLRVPRLALYAGQGVPHFDSGEVAWALERGGFPYRLLDGRDFTREGTLADTDVIVVPNGSAGEIARGWDPEGTSRKPPWQPHRPPEGIGERGLGAIRRFVEAGGTYVGLGGGGARLAGKDYLGLTTVEMVSAEVGIGQVVLRVVRPDSRLLFGYRRDTLPAFFYAPPGSPAGGYAFRGSDAAVAAYHGALEFRDELSFTSTEPLSAAAGNAAIVHQRFGRGQVVLFGIAPAFRAQWKSTFPLLYNALYLAVLPPE
jgi:hypothetical protein